MKRNIWLFFSMVFLFGACSDFLNMPPKNTKVVYTISDVRDAMSTLLFATTSSSYHSGGTISNSVRFNDEYVQFPFTRYCNVASILYTNDLDMVNFLFDDFVNPGPGRTWVYKRVHGGEKLGGIYFPGAIVEECFHFCRLY